MVLDTETRSVETGGGMGLGLQAKKGLWQTFYIKFGSIKYFGLKVALESPDCKKKKKKVTYSPSYMLNSNH